MQILALPAVSQPTALRIQHCACSYGKNGMVLTVAKIVAVSNGYVPLVTQSLKPFQKLCIGLLRVMAKQKACYKGHNTALFQSPDESAFAFNAVESFVIFYKKNVAAAFIQRDPPNRRKKNKVAQVAADQCALCRTGNQCMPGGIGDVFLR